MIQYQGKWNLLDKGALDARMHSAQWGKPVTRSERQSGAVPQR
jgi:hypothetical protein